MSDSHDELPVLHHLAELAGWVGPRVFVRFSKGPADDRDRRSNDYESGLEMSGLSVNRLQPEPWWTRPVDEWLARQLCNYVHLQEQSDDPRRPWILEGEIVAHGPDNEPLVAGFRPLAWLTRSLVEEAKTVYQERFDVAEDST